MATESSPRALSAREFFALKLPGGNRHVAHMTTGLAYTTILRAEAGGNVEGETLTRLERWSLALPVAQERGIYLSASATLGLGAPTAPARDVA